MPLVPGYTPLTDTEQFTWAKFRKAFTSGSATIANQGQIVPGVITVSPSAPSGKTGDGWFDTSLGSGYGSLRIFDGSDWKWIATGWIAQNKTGLQLNVGEPVRLDSTTTTLLAGSRVAVVRTTAQTQFPLGVVATQMNNDETGLVITYGKVKAVKDAAAITAGQPMAPSATAAQWTTNSVGGWGNPFGSGTAGMWIESSAAAAGTLTGAFLWGPTMASWAAFKSAPATLINNVAPSALATWQTAVSWSTSPAGTVAHLIQARVVVSTAITIATVQFGARANGSSLTIDTGAAFISAAIDDTGLSAREGLRGIFWVPYGTTDDKFQWYVDGPAGTYSVLVHEVGVMAGGGII